MTRDPVSRAVAVVGVGAVLPDAPSAPEFWQNVLAGRDSISEVPADRWDPADYYDPDPKAPEKTYSKIGGWVRQYHFDPTRLRIPPTVAKAMDEGQKWVVAAALEAMKDYGYPERPLDVESTACILGNAMGGELHYIPRCASTRRSTSTPSRRRPRSRRSLPRRAARSSPS